MTAAHHDDLILRPPLIDYALHAIPSRQPKPFLHFGSVIWQPAISHYQNELRKSCCLADDAMSTYPIPSLHLALFNQATRGLIQIQTRCLRR